MSCGFLKFRHPYWWIRLKDLNLRADIVSLGSTEHTSRGGRSRYKKEWGNLTTRASEEPINCSDFSKITHRYIPDSQRSLQHSRACQEVGGTAVASDLYTWWTLAICRNRDDSPGTCRIRIPDCSKNRKPYLQIQNWTSKVEIHEVIQTLT